MRYFTFKWWAGDIEDVAVAIDAYGKYLLSIKESLPAELRDLVDRHSLHDANLERVLWNTRSGTVTLTLLGSDPQHQEARRYTLTYLGVSQLELLGTSDDALGGPGGFGDLGYDEIFVLENGFFEHRLLFSTGIELHCQFATFDLRYELAA